MFANKSRKTTRTYARRDRAPSVAPEESLPSTQREEKHCVIYDPWKPMRANPPWGLTKPWVDLEPRHGTEYLPNLEPTERQKLDEAHYVSFIASNAKAKMAQEVYYLRYKLSFNLFIRLLETGFDNVHMTDGLPDSRRRSYERSFNVESWLSLSWCKQKEQDLIQRVQSILTPDTWENLIAQCRVEVLFRFGAELAHKEKVPLNQAQRKLRSVLSKGSNQLKFILYPHALTRRVDRNLGRGEQDESYPLRKVDSCLGKANFEQTHHLSKTDAYRFIKERIKRLDALLVPCPRRYGTTKRSHLSSFIDLTYAQAVVTNVYLNKYFGPQKELFKHLPYSEAA